MITLEAYLRTYEISTVEHFGENSGLTIFTGSKYVSKHWLVRFLSQILAYLLHFQKIVAKFRFQYYVTSSELIKIYSA